MRYLNPTTFKYLSAALLLISVFSLPFIFSTARSQTRQRTVTPNRVPQQTTNTEDAGRMPALPAALPATVPAAANAEVVKVDVDLVTIDALVLQKNTARVVGDLKKEDFILLEDGTKQEITHFGQDSLPLSVLLLIDRGGCLDPFGSHVRAAALDAISHLKPTDEVAVMSYHNTTQLLQGFTRDRTLVAEALNRVPPHDEEADHCLNKVFFDAGDYMIRSSNPVGRRVIIAITGVTRNLDCPDGPSGKAAAREVYESGSVVCGIIPKTIEQKIESGIMIWTTSMGNLGGPSLDIKTLANETGGEVLEDKPEYLNATFNTLIDHLRTRYNLAFVSTNKKRDGSTRKLKIDIAPSAQTKSKLVVKARRSYVAPRS
jgi:Ca-activated chloride channel homolog